MKFPMNHKYLWAVLVPLLAATTAAEAQYSFAPTPGYGTPDPYVAFESVAYFKAVKSTSGSTRTYTIDASTKASNVPGASGSNYTLTWWADSTHAYTVNSGIWDLNFKGTSTSATGAATCSSTSLCNVSIKGTGLSSTAANMSWLASTMPAIYSAFNGSSTNRNLFSATLTAFDAFGEGTTTTADNALAFRWTNPTGALAPFADLFNFAYLGNVNTNNFGGSAFTLSTTQAIQHTNVPVPAAVYLFGSALLFLRRMAMGGQRKALV